MTAPLPEPIPHRCRASRLGRLGPHHDHRAELEREQAEGRVPDETWAMTISSIVGLATIVISAVSS